MSGQRNGRERIDPGKRDSGKPHREHMPGEDNREGEPIPGHEQPLGEPSYSADLRSRNGGDDSSSSVAGSRTSAMVENAIKIGSNGMCMRGSARNTANVTMRMLVNEHPTIQRAAVERSIRRQSAAVYTQTGTINSHTNARLHNRRKRRSVGCVKPSSVKLPFAGQYPCNPSPNPSSTFSMVWRALSGRLRKAFTPSR